MDPVSLPAANEAAKQAQTRCEQQWQGDSLVVSRVSVTSTNEATIENTRAGRLLHSFIYFLFTF